jgi:predicted RNA-binding Zn-ribbon protein involved in translation (DUF1610 family)
LVRESANRILEVNPTLTYAEIGRLLGVSRERIRQVAGRRRRTIRECKACGRTIRVRKNGVTQTAYQLGYCANCWALARQRRLESHRVRFACEVCGRAFFRTPSIVRRMEARGHKIRWCSRQCQGKWLGSQHERSLTE